HHAGSVCASFGEGTLLAHFFNCKCNMPRVEAQRSSQLQETNSEGVANREGKILQYPPLLCLLPCSCHQYYRSIHCL
ncbi:hypothetical protein PENTCL1PPCAC_24906, partial [Pristionchus entomophagus]